MRLDKVHVPSKTGSPIYGVSAYYKYGPTKDTAVGFIWGRFKQPLVLHRFGIGWDRDLPFSFIPSTFVEDRKDCFDACTSWMGLFYGRSSRE